MDRGCGINRQVWGLAIRPRNIEQSSTACAEVQRRVSNTDVQGTTLHLTARQEKQGPWLHKCKQRTCKPLLAHSNAVSCRLTHSIGRTSSTWLRSCRCHTMAASPSAPLPLIMLSSSVSALSVAVWPVATWLQPAAVAIDASCSYRHSRASACANG